MNRNKKNLHRVTANVLGITLASVVAVGAVPQAAATVPVYAAQQTQKGQNVSKTVYLNGAAAAAEKADGSTKEKAVNTLEAAIQQVGSNGVIMVSGTVTVSSEKSITIPSGVQVKRGDGFKGSIIKITGKGKLTLTGSQIAAADVDTSSAEAGSNAFQIEKKETKKVQAVSVPSAVTIKTPEEFTSFNFQASGFSGDGTFAWANQQAPAAYESDVQAVFTPKDTANTDYSQVSGWNAQSKTVVRTVKVTVESLKPQEKPQEEPAKEQIVPEKKEAGSVQMPSEVTFKTPQEWEKGDFAALGFAGNGTFAWETSTPSGYETQTTVTFTPADAETLDYSQVPGWNQESQKVVRSIKVTIESLKPADKEDEKQQETDEKTEKPSDSDKKDEKEEKPSDSDKKEEKDEKEEKEEKPSDTDKKEDSTDNVIIERVEDVEKESSEEEKQEDVKYAAEPGLKGEVAQEEPESIPVGSLIDESGVQVYGDFLPFYVDLQVSYNDAVDELPDAGIGQILSAYELKLWDLKEDEEYKIPEGKKVKVMIPLPENANCFSDLSIAHYLGNNQYEYFIFDRDGKIGNMSVEEQDGKEYLTFETASFSPFNVGGHQIVGPGTNSTNHPVQGGSTSNNKPASSGSTGNNSAAGSQGGSTSAAKPAAGTSSQNTGSKNSNTTVSASGNTGTRVIRTVKTEDESNVLLYGAGAAAALLAAAGAVLTGRKKKTDK